MRESETLLSVASGISQEIQAGRLVPTRGPLRLRRRPWAAGPPQAVTRYRAGGLQVTVRYDAGLGVTWGEARLEGERRSFIHLGSPDGVPYLLKCYQDPLLSAAGLALEKAAPGRLPLNAEERARAVLPPAAGLLAGLGALGASGLVGGDAMALAGLISAALLALAWANAAQLDRDGTGE